ncbi:MAG TPA: hypothetical protein VE783_01510 [Candidatus Limnocylindrales bacterium]|jgi:DNA-binding response OmpR family regulator|nr:hypothetical protein [Candidatus Limnocylindrales bacterium]
MCSQGNLQERRKNTVMIVSLDRPLGDRRKQALEKAGIPAFVVYEVEGVSSACNQHHPRAVVFGRSLPPAEKRRAWLQVRNACHVPIIELFEHDVPEEMPAAYLHQLATPDDFVDTVKKLLKRRR